ncbi:MAG: thioredoxin family protein [Bdellovibrionales bacterium]|nr:thioredoxin family protein [Bdellovibrionales bacterium]
MNYQRSWLDKGLLAILTILAISFLLLITSNLTYAFDATEIANKLTSNNSNLSIIFWCFFGGLLSCLTPCVYPLIPITLGIFGARQETSKLKAFALSLAYVIGIASCFTTLGLIAVLSGSFFGSVLSSSFVKIGIVILLFCLALYTLDILNLSFLHKLQAAANKFGGKGYQGSFLMGAASGIIAAPCVGPVLLTILVIASSTNSMSLSISMLFFYALGLGFPFLILGTFSPLLSKLPQSGSWLSVVKFILSVFILAVLIFFSQGLLSDELLSAIYNINSIFISIIALSCFILSNKLKSNFLKLIAAILFAFLISLSFLPEKTSTPTTQLANSLNLKNTPELIWYKNLETAQIAASKNNQVLMVDLYADWCAACKELDKLTFSDEKVVSKLAKFKLARIDFTNLDEEANRISEKYNVIGLPCILFLDSSGKELKNSRITGYLEADEFLQHLEKLSH